MAAQEAASHTAHFVFLRLYRICLARAWPRARVRSRLRSHFQSLMRALCRLSLPCRARVPACRASVHAASPALRFYAPRLSVSVFLAPVCARVHHHVFQCEATLGTSLLRLRARHAQRARQGAAHGRKHPTDWTRLQRMDGSNLQCQEAAKRGVAHRARPRAHRQRLAPPPCVRLTCSQRRRLSSRPPCCWLASNGCPLSYHWTP